MHDATLNTWHTPNEQMALVLNSCKENNTWPSAMQKRSWRTMNAFPILKHIWSNQNNIKRKPNKQKHAEHYSYNVRDWNSVPPYPNLLLLSTILHNACFEVP